MYQSTFFEDQNRKNPRLTAAASPFVADKPKTNPIPANPMKTSNYNEMPLSQYYDNILNKRANEKSRDSNPMFRSQSMNRGAAAAQDSQAEINRNIKAFSLPQDIVKFLEEEPDKLAGLKAKLQEEKDSVDRILDGVMKEVSAIIEQKRAGIKGIFDSFLSTYEKSREAFMKKINTFKDTSKILSNNKFGGSSDRLMSLESIEFFDEDRMIKEEVCNVKCRLGSLTKEIEKKYLSFYAQNLEKELHHMPSFSRSENALEYLADMTKIIKEKVSSNLEILDGLVYKVDTFKFDQLSIKPNLKPSLGESKSNLIANIGNLLDRTEPFKVEHIPVTYSRAVTCLCVIEEDLVATGHSDNSIGIWNMSKSQEVATLTGHSHPISSLVAIKAYFPEINLPKNSKLEVGYIKNRNIKQQNFLLSATEGHDCELFSWDLQAMTQLKAYTGHRDTVTSMIALRDGHTMITGSLDASVRVWDISDPDPLLAIVENDRSTVSHIHVFNDYSHFVTSGSSGEIFIYKMSYAYNRRYDRTVFEACRKVRCIRTSSPVFVLNESMIRDNVVISGGADKAVSFWNTVTCTEQKRIGSHNTEVVGCVLIENPLKTKANSFVLSFGNYDHRLQITDSSTGESKEMTLDSEVSLAGGKNSNPNMQFMPTTDIFGRSQTHLLCAGSKNGMPCLVKILIEQEDKEHLPNL